MQRQDNSNLIIKIISALMFVLCSLFFAPCYVFAFCYEEAGREYHINPVLLRAISKNESSLNHSAINTNANGTRDIGLMQINSSWVDALHLNPVLLLSDPCYNLKAGADILRNCLDHSGYTWEAIGCYNAVSKDKRVKYSWKIFEQLRSSEFRVQSSELKDDNHPILQTPNSKLMPQNSTFLFSIKDRTQTETEQQ